MAGDGVAGAPLDLAQHALQLVVRERLDLAAVVADEVMVMLATRLDRFESGRPCADIDPLHEPIPSQLLERPVDARDPDSPSFVAQLVEDLLCREAAVLSAEQLDN